jgi:hypothetical protein
MPAYTPVQLAAMFEMATANTARVQEAARTGGDPVGLMNKIFDIPIVTGMWRKKRGGYELMALKGMHHLERIVATGRPELRAVAYFDTGTAEAAMAICAAYCQNPDARWEQAFVDGRPVGMGLV